MKRQSLVGLLLMVLFCALPVDGQEAAAKSLRIEEAVKYGLAGNKGLAADRQQIIEATARLRQAGLKANPMIEGAGQTGINDRGMQNLALGVTLPLEPGRRQRRIDLAGQELNRVIQEVADRERLLASEIRMKYAEVIETDRSLALLRQMVGINQQIQMLVRARVEEGSSPKIEENMQTVELRRAETRVEEFEGRKRALTEELKGMLGWPADEELKLVDEFAAVQIGQTRGEMIETALRIRPDLVAAISGEAIGEAMIEMARAEGRFDLSIFGELGWQRLRFDQLGQMADSGTLVPVGMRTGMIRGGVNITLPLRNRNQGNIEAAVAYRGEARLRREFIESIIRREVAAADERRLAAARVLRGFDDELISTQEKSLNILRTSFELGHARLTDLLAEQRRLLDLQMERNSALRDAFVAHIELAKAIGMSLNIK